MTPESLGAGFSQCFLLANLSLVEQTLLHPFYGEG